MSKPRKPRPRYGPQYEEDFGPRTEAQISRRLRRTQYHALAAEVEMALSTYRWKLTLTQEQLADILGVKQPQVARLESGVVTPTLQTLLRISQCTGIEFALVITPDGMVVTSALPGAEAPEVKRALERTAATPRPGNRPA